MYNVTDTYLAKWKSTCEIVPRLHNVSYILGVNPIYEAISLLKAITFQELYKLVYHVWHNILSRACFVSFLIVRRSCFLTLLLCVHRICIFMFGFNILFNWILAPHLLHMGANGLKTPKCQALTQSESVQVCCGIV